MSEDIANQHQHRDPYNHNWCSFLVTGRRHWCCFVRSCDQFSVPSCYLSHPRAQCLHWQLQLAPAQSTVYRARYCSVLCCG